MTCVFWICRHGKTEWNNKNIRQGQMDSQLTDEGVIHANSLASLFSLEEAELYSSPLGRAIATTNIIAKKNRRLSINIDGRLKEISFGILEGKKKCSTNPVHSSIISKFKQNPFYFSFPRGESYTDLLVRVKSFLTDLKRKKNNIIIVGHEDINRILLMVLLNISESNVVNISQPNHIIYKVQDGIVSNININNHIVNDGLIYEGI